jgi:hypothetical protein
LDPDVRSIEEAARRLGKHPSSLKRWSAQFDWFRRAACWDAEYARAINERTGVEANVRREEQLRQIRNAEQAVMNYIRAFCELASRGQLYAGTPLKHLPGITNSSANALVRMQAADSMPEPIQHTAAEAYEPNGEGFDLVSEDCGNCDHHRKSHQPRGRALACQMRGCHCANYVEQRNAEVHIGDPGPSDQQEPQITQRYDEQQPVGSADTVPEPGQSPDEPYPARRQYRHIASDSCENGDDHRKSHVSNGRTPSCESGVIV